MLAYLHGMSDASLFALLSVLLVGSSIISLFIVRRFIPLDARYRDNHVLGPISGLISIIYGVLVGITALYLINNVDFIADAIQNEANSIANIYRESLWLQQPAQQELQADVKKYLTNIMEVEWPLMQAGKIPAHVDGELIDKMEKVIRTYKISGPRDTIIITDLLGEIKSLYNARHHRIQMAHSGLAPQIWLVILVGTILTIVINYLFGAHFYLHLLIVSLVSLMAAAMLFLLVTLDRPFQGDFVVVPDAFHHVLNYINSHSSTI